MSPNPLVGAVLVQGGRVIGEGFHRGPKTQHAERQALESATEDPTGATLYVTVEPCPHHGNTPPCTDAIIEAGIARVVMGSSDPTPKASGRGPRLLAEAGVSVELASGESADRARELNQPFFKHSATGRPFVIAKFAQSLDGRVATATGQSQWISSPESRKRAHSWRADCDAVCVGISTAERDDPELTARVDGEFNPPARVIFDSRARLSVTSRLVAGAKEHPLTVVAGTSASPDRVSELRRRGADVIVCAQATEAERVEAALTELGSRGVQSLLLEGGPHLAGAFYDAGEIDEVRAFIAPLVIAGQRARSPIEGKGAGALDLAPRAIGVVCERIADDVLISCRLREW